MATGLQLGLALAGLASVGLAPTSGPPPTPQPPGSIETPAEPPDRRTAPDAELTKDASQPTAHLHAAAAPGRTRLVTLTLSGPPTVPAGGSATYGGRLAVAGVGAPLQRVDVLVDGVSRARTRTGLRGAWSAGITLGSLGSHELRAIAFAGTPLVVRTGVLLVQAVAPPVDATAATDIHSATSFLYTGADPTQKGVPPGTIEALRVAVLRGRVVGNDGETLPAVRITVLDHPELGHTLTRDDGSFDMAVNGGGPLTLRYAKDGYPAVHRRVQAPWRDYVVLDDVVIVPFDTEVSTIDFSQPMQLHRGSPISDADGARRATLLFSGGTAATMTLPDGSTRPLATMHVRATEFTVGDRGREAMPAPLPPTSGYTYAVELSADEAVAAGATEVRFSKPVVGYVEDFLGFPVGSAVPLGFYDRVKGVWVPADNGRVVKVLGATKGKADLDVDGSGRPADAAALQALGVTDAERESIASLYPAGQSLWRIAVAHFTPWDLNWPYGPPGDARGPGQPRPDPGTPLEAPCTRNGSTIECQNQTLGEAIEVAGTPLVLHYRSDRAPGRVTTIHIPLSGPAVPSSLRRIELEITVAGRRFAESFPPAPNQSYDFTWDRTDAYGREVQGGAVVSVRVDYVYGAVYQTAEESLRGFAEYGTRVTAVRARGEIVISQESQTTAGGTLDARAQGLGGWTASVHHAYDPASHTLYRGDGEQRPGVDVRVARTAAGGGRGGLGDGGPATAAQLTHPVAVAVGPDGSVYIAEPGGWFATTVGYRVRRVGPDGVMTTAAGTGEGCPGGPCGDGGPATQARLAGTLGQAMGPDGSFYVADGARVRRVGTDGIITTVAGGGSGGDGGPATEASLWPFDVAVGPESSLYIADQDSAAIRRVGPDGIITTVAGGGSGGDGGPATDAELNPWGVAVGPDGSLYIAELAPSRIRRVGPDGIIATVAGTGDAGYSGDGGPAAQAMLAYPEDLSVAPDGSLYIADTENQRIRRVGPDGIITTVAGTGVSGYGGDGGPAVIASLSRPSDVGLAGDGSLIIADESNHRVRRVGADGVITTAAGDGRFGGDGWPAVRAELYRPTGTALGPDGTLYVAESYYIGRVRRVGPDGIITTVAGGRKDGPLGDGGPATEAALDPFGLAVAPDGSLYISDILHKRVRRVGPDGIITTVAGGGAGGDGVPATEAALQQPLGIAVAPDGSLYVADAVADKVRRVGADGIITTVAGTGVRGFSGDGGPARDARLYGPFDVALHADGSLYIADNGNFRVRRVGPDGTITTVAGNGLLRYGGDGGPATSAAVVPVRLAVGRDGALYILDEHNLRVRRVLPSGIITTVAGTGRYLNGADGGLAAATDLRTQAGIVVAPDGDLYISEDDRIRRVAGVLPGFSGTDIAVPSEDGNLLYRFDADGRHQSTLNALTGAVVYEFGYDGGGRLVTITNGDGDRTAVDRDADGRPTAIVAPFGQRTTLGVDTDGYLRAVTNPAGDAVRLAYAPGGLLETMTNPRGAVHIYAYDARGRLVKDTNPVGGFVELARTDRADGYAVTTRNALGHTKTVDVARLADGGERRTTIYPNAARRTQLTQADGTRVVTDPKGAVTTIVLGPDARWGMQAPVVTSMITAGSDGRAYQTLRTTRTVTLADPLDPLSLQTQTDVVTINGRTTATVYDAPARTTTGTDPAGSRTTILRDGQGRPLRAQTADHAPIAYSYDAHGRLARMAEGEGGDARTTLLSYNSDGDLDRVTDPLGGTTASTYDGAGRLVSQTLPSGQRLTFTYDRTGNLTGSTDPRGVPTTFEYDLHDRRAATTLDPGGRAVRTELSYDLADNLVTRVDDAGAGRLNIATALQYTPVDADRYLVARTTDAVGAETRFAYTAFGEPSAFTDALGTTSVTYTPQGWRSTVTTPGGRTTRTTYNDDGQPVMFADPRGVTTRYAYDAAGRLSSVTAGAAAVDGSPAVDQTTTYAYDVHGRVIAVTDPRGKSGTTTYDAFGRVSATADPVGNTITYAYDALDRVVLQTVGANVDGEAIRTAYTYDAVGRPLTERVDPDGLNLTTRYFYTSPDTTDTWRLQRVVDPSGNATRFRYNSLGLRDQVTDAAGETWRFEFDNRGRPTAQVDPLGRRLAYTMDALGRRTALTEAGRTERWTYRPDDLVASHTDFAGRTTTFGYDADSLPVSVDYPVGTADVGFVRDAAGNVVSMTDGLGTSTHRYDAVNRLRSRARDGRTVSYTYDAANQVAGIDHWGRGSVQYGYDDSGRPAQLTPWGEQATTYHFTATGLLAGQARGNGATTTWAHDGAGRPTSLLHERGGAALQHIRYEVDPKGNRTRITDGDGVTTYAYDALNRLTRADYPAVPGGPSAAATTYTYDAVGNRLGDGAATFEYDEADRITSPGFAYDENGNLLGDGRATYRYDAANRLVQTVSNGVTTTYDYDGWGNLVRETAGGVATDIVWDERGELPQILGEVRSDGTELHYAWGPEGAGAQRELRADAPPAMAYTMLDGLGSVRGLTDQAGSVVWAASYDAFGVPRYASGAARTTLGYTGARTGAADGTVHLRARQLSPSLGRFLQRDSVAGLPARPQSLNRYAYTENNATTATDPSGHQSRPYTPPSNPYPYVRNSVAGGCRPAGVEDEIRALQRRLDELRRERGLFDKIFLGDFEDEALDIQLKINALQGGRQQLEQRLYDTLNSPDVMALRVFANPTSRVLIGGDLETWQAVPWGQRVLEGGLAAAFYGASLYRGGQAFREVGRLRKAEEELAGRRVLSWRGESTVITASSEITAFRVYGGEARQAGKWVTLGRPASARAALEASALPPGNTAQFVSEYRIPAGTRLRIGVTHEAYGAPGGGLQIRLLDRIPGSAIEPGVELPLGSLSSR